MRISDWSSDVCSSDLVQLPGVQDTTRVKDLLGATATLEYRAVADGDAQTAAATGVVPAGTQLFYHRDTHQPILLKREVIAGGDNLVEDRKSTRLNSSH